MGNELRQTNSSENNKTKTMTEAALAANRTNAQKSTGPRRSERVSQNARKHGLLSKKVTFESDEEGEFRRLLADLYQDLRPVGRLEILLVEEIGLCAWKLRIAGALEQEEIQNRRLASAALMRTIAESSYEQRVAFFTKSAGGPSQASLGWQCQELIVRCDRGESQQQERSSGDHGSRGNVHVEAKLTNALDPILRYQAAIKRDFYRASDSLRQAQQARREAKEG